MSRAARSVVVFGLYMLSAGALLLVAPPEALRTTDPAAPFPPVRMFGLLTAIVGGYYVAAGRHELVGFFRLTIPGRAVAAAAMTGLVGVGVAGPALLGLAAIDAAGACWTAIGLRNATPAAAHGAGETEVQG